MASCIAKREATMTQDLDRRTFLGIAAAVGIAGEASAEQEAPQPAQPGPGVGSRPNIVLFMPDELRADALACYGNPVTKTPNFDRLAKEGTRFSNCYVQYPVCSASRCSML